MKTQAIGIILLLLAVVAHGKDLTQAEIDYKAEFIIKVVDYVTWPADAKTDTNGAIVIAVLGDSQLLPTLQTLADKKSGDGPKVVAKAITMEDDLTACQILFVTTEDKTELAAILKKIKNAPVLTVSDAYYFARYGVMVNFYTEEVKGKQKVKFEVNTMTMGFVGLKMSSKLLKLATII
jgi:hypothetical protein